MAEPSELVKSLVTGYSDLKAGEHSKLWEGLSAELPEAARGELAVKLTRDLPSSMRKEALAEGAKGLSTKDRREAFSQSGAIPNPGSAISDKLWLMVICSFCIVLVGAFITLAIAVFLKRPDYQVLLTVFTSIVGFLAGLFAPSPVGRDSASNGGN